MNQIPPHVDFLRRSLFYLGRVIASFYRLNTLRLAETLFRNVQAGTILKRRFFGRVLVLDVSRANPQKLLWLQGERFVRERSLLRSSMQPGMTIVDVGANIGYCALMFSSYIRYSGRVYCIEPDTSNLLELHANVVENRLEELVTVVAAAAGERDGIAKFEPGLNSHVVAHGSAEVPLKKLDSLLSGNVDFIKIDVEGYEGAVLEGAAKIIERCRPTMFVELHPQLLTKHSHSGIVQLLLQNYSRVTAYQIEPRGAAARALQSYGLLRPFSMRSDVQAMASDYEAGRFLEPCWLLAQAR